MMEERIEQLQKALEAQVQLASQIERRWETALKQLSRREETLRKEQEALITERRSLQQEIGTMEGRKAQLSEEVATLAQRLESMRNEVEVVSVDLAQVRESMAAQRITTIELQVRIKEETERLTGLQRACHGVEMEVSDRRDVLALLRMETEQERARLSQLRADRQAEEQEYASIQANVADAMAERGALQGEVSDLRAELGQTEAGLAAAQATVQELAAQRQAHEEAIADLQASYRSLRPWTPTGPLPQRLVDKQSWSGRLPRIYHRALDAMVAHPAMFPGYPVGAKEDIVAEALRNFLPWGQEGVGDAFALGLALENQTSQESSKLVDFEPPSPGVGPKRRGGRPPEVLKLLESLPQPGEPTDTK